MLVIYEFYFVYAPASAPRPAPARPAQTAPAAPSDEPPAIRIIPESK